MFKVGDKILAIDDYYGLTNVYLKYPMTVVEILSSKHYFDNEDIRIEIDERDATDETIHIYRPELGFLVQSKYFISAHSYYQQEEAKKLLGLKDV